MATATKSKPKAPKSQNGTPEMTVAVGLFTAATDNRSPNLAISAATRS